MRILLQLAYPGYLRIYGSLVTELAARGHTVLLAYDSEKRRDAEAERVEAAPGVELVGAPPRRGGRSADLVLNLRLAADYVRYLDPRFASADPLRRRMERFLPPSLRWLERMPVFPAPVARAVTHALALIERRVPPVPRSVSWLRRLAPDCVVVSPVVARGLTGAHQTDTLRAARALGVPVAAGIMSWDHLTSKGLLKGEPDRVLLWNAAQREEAISLHRIPAERVVVTGAQAFDQWFGRSPTTTRREHLERLGLDPDAAVLLYVGSSPNIAPAEREIPWVCGWLSALRATSDKRLATANVLVRPHPGNVDAWAVADLAGTAKLAVWPVERPSIPMSDADQAIYFDSLHHADAVVGVNTSAMIEAAIVGRPVHTIRAPEFTDTQEGTLHFRMLLADGGGPVRTAESLEAHCRQLSEAVADPEAARRRLEPFVRSFVRPHGLERRATDVLADAIEALPGLAQPTARS